MLLQDSGSMDATTAGVPSTSFDVVQDSPAAWDWRLIVLFVAFACCFLYMS